MTQDLSKFNLERVRLYIEALRSGEYIQTTDKLNDGGCFCALGVAADVAIKGGARAVWLEDGGAHFLQDNGFFDNGEDWTDIALTQSVVNWYGGSPGSVNMGSGEWEALYIHRANDSLGWSFPQIADRLEQLFFPEMSV